MKVVVGVEIVVWDGPAGDVRRRRTGVAASRSEARPVGAVGWNRVTVREYRGRPRNEGVGLAGGGGPGVGRVTESGG